MSYADGKSGREVLRFGAQRGGVARHPIVDRRGSGGVHAPLAPSA